MIDFYSDTKTRPTRPMRAAIAAAEVGDEQQFEDPTTNRLTARVAELLGKEAAVFLPSGTMCNEIALNIWCRPGEEVICEAGCHLLNFECGGPAALSGLVLKAIDGERGMLGAAQVAAAIRPAFRHFPVSRLVAVEQTANLAGGTVWPLARLDAVAAVARDAGLATHMDGARLFNAVVASGVPADRQAAGFDSVWVDFSKGLGCPVGAVLAGSRGFIEEAWVRKQRWGGAMRQSGILAAACLYALDHHIDRLAEDHALAAEIAERLSAIDGIARVVAPDSNIVFFDLAPDRLPAPDLARRLQAEHAIQIGAFGPHRLRLVTHLDVTPADGRTLTEAIGGLL